MDELDFQDLCLIYTTSLDEYANETLSAPTTVPCMYEQTTGYAHGASRDEITGVSRLLLPGDDPFVQEHEYRLEGMVVEINPFGASGPTQRFKITSVTPARDVLLGNQVWHVDCQLKKVETEAYVS